MALPPLSTILNNAPLIIQGANKLIKMLREKNDVNEQTEEFTNDPSDLQQELKKIHARLDNTDDSNIQQIELIEALAKQNESLANSLQSAIKRLNLVSIIAVIAAVFSIVCLIKLFNLI